MRTKRVIFIKGAVETLEYFSVQLADSLEEKGIRTWFWDMKHPLSSRQKMEEFCRPGETALITFNFIGQSGESEFLYQDRYIWDWYGVDCYCIMVDHPIYYYKQLMAGTPEWKMICIDRDHQKFVENYYPEYGSCFFLPLGGTELRGKKVPYEEREIEVLFAGNYVELDMLEANIAQMEEDNREFFRNRIGRLIEHPHMPLELEFIGGLLEELPDISREELLESLYHMCVIDLYVRSYFRRNIICALAESGIRVHVIGKDWEKAGCRKPENLIMLGQLNSEQCLEYMSRSKVVINIMPWFKKGAHDRIFNGMLQGCAVVTDSSEYLDEVLESGRDFAEYILEDYSQICDLVKRLSAQPERGKALAAAGYHTAKAGHTWGIRGETLIREILC